MQVNINSIMAYTDWMTNNSNNIANVNTQGYKATDTVLENNGLGVVATSSKSESGTNLAKEITDQISITKGIDANATAIKTQEQIVGSILNLLI